MGRRSKRNPQTYSLRIHSEARYNIRHIVNYIAFIEHQPINALKVYAAIYDVIGKIGQNPFAFKECEEIPTVAKIYRRANCYSWSIIYKILGSEVFVLGVIHQASKASRIKDLKKRK